MEFQKENGRIFYKEGRTVLAEITFPETLPGIREIQHTYVAESMRGQGIAGKLAAAAVAEIAAEGYKARVSCGYVEKWLKQHPDAARSLRWQKEELHAQLKQMGILSSDTVMIHSSLRALGPVEGDANGLIEALRDYLQDGLLLIPTHTWADVNAANPYFDSSASVPCIGTLPQVAAFHPDGIRSLHPTHSIAAFGRRAAEYVRGEEKAATPAPSDGCWGRLYEENAKILLVGVSQNRNTYLHSVEEMLNIPDRLGEQTYLVNGTDGKGFCWEQPMHPHRCSRTDDISQFYPKYLPAFQKYGAVTIGQLGSARTEVCSARRCADILRQIWQRADGEIGVGHEPLDPALYENLQ